MSSRKRRSSSRQLQEDGSPDPDVLVVDEEASEPPRRKRRSASAASAGAAAAAPADSDAEDQPAAAAAAAAAGGGSNGAGPSGVAARERQPRVAFEQQEADIMMDQIKKLEADASIAEDSAAALDVQQTTLDAAVARVVRFLLFRHHEKPGVPVKRQDINEVFSGVAGVAKGSKAAKKLPGLVITLVAAKLASTFGMELRELKKGDTGAAATAAAAAAAAGSSGQAAAAAAGGANTAPGTQTYKLLSMLPLDLLARYGQQSHDHQERGFVTIVLALLQLKQYKMDEDELWRHLQQLGIEREDQDAAVPFGKHPTKVMESMEHSKYLVKSKEAAPNTERGTLITYEWGEAAHSEFGGGALEGIVTQFLEAPADTDD